MAAQAYEDIMGPQQKYKLTEQELDLLLKEKLIDQNAYNAALAQAISLKARSAKQGLEGSVDQLNPGGGKMQELQQRMQALQGMQSTGTGLDGSKLDAGDLAAVQLEMQAIAAEQDQILLKTGGIDAGIKAWADDLQRVQSMGEFVFDTLSQATKGFEDDAAKSLLDMLEVQKGGHDKMIKQLRTMWSGFFNGLAEKGLKFGMQQLLAPIGNKIGGSIGRAVSGTAKSAGGAASLTAAGTALQSAATQLMSAAVALRSSASMGSGGTAGGGVLGDLTDSGAGSADVGENAAGTSDWAGGRTWVGEQGPEILDLPRGSQITSNDDAMKGSGGDIHNHYYDQRGAVVTDELMRKGDAVRLMARTKMAAVGEAIANMSEIKRRSTGA